MQTYARQGGTSSIFVNDDGLRIMPPAVKDARIAFYALHGIAWVARPGHGDLGEENEQEEIKGEKDTQARGKGKAKQQQGDMEKNRKKQREPKPFYRAGRFKKASNMNYGMLPFFMSTCFRSFYLYLALALTLKLERHLQRLLCEAGMTTPESEGSVEGRTRYSNGTTEENGSGVTEEGVRRSGSTSYSPDAAHNTNRRRSHIANEIIFDDRNSSMGPANGNQTSLEDQALASAIEEMWEESGRRHRPWAANARAARIGEIVLLVDSDTVVPEVGISVHSEKLKIS